jgi:hypothetical protein
MHRRRYLGILVAALPLAGCAGSSDDPDEDSANGTTAGENTTEDEKEPADVTEPTDGEGQNTDSESDADQGNESGGETESEDPSDESEDETESENDEANGENEQDEKTQESDESEDETEQSSDEQDGSGDEDDAGGEDTEDQRTTRVDEGVEIIEPQGTISADNPRVLIATAFEEGTRLYLTVGSVGGVRRPIFQRLNGEVQADGSVDLAIPEYLRSSFQEKRGTDLEITVQGGRSKGALDRVRVTIE